MGIFKKDKNSNAGNPSMSESRFIVFTGEFLDGFESEVESSKNLLIEMQDSESTGPVDDIFLDTYNRSIAAFLKFRLSFSDELTIGQSRSTSLIVPNPFKLFQLVQVTASRHMQNGPTLMNTMITNWHELNQAALSGAIPMFPGQGLSETQKWRGTKLGSIMRAATKFESGDDVQKQADEIAVDAISRAFTLGLDKYGLGEPGSMMASISTSMIFAWKESIPRNILAANE